MKNRLFVLAVLMAAGIMLCNTGCKRKKGGLISSDSNISGVAGMPGSADYASEGWATDRPDSMQFRSDIQFDTVLFDYDSTQVHSTERSKIETVADYLRRNQSVGVVVEGHCDERGSREYNMALGERRALAVRAYLIGLGIDGAIIQTKSYGKENPVAFGHDEASWATNRRAEFSFFNY